LTFLLLYYILRKVSNYRLGGIKEESMHNYCPRFQGFYPKKQAECSCQKKSDKKGKKKGEEIHKPEDRCLEAGCYPQKKED
jgi:hypothetical protein